jgi:phosphate transport system substrate-binding protein
MMRGTTKTVRALAAVGLSAALLSGCGTAGPTASPDLAATRAAIAAAYPRVDGSTSDFPLARLLACDVLGVKCVWSAPASDNVERTYIPDPKASNDPAAAEAINAIKFNTTHNSFVNLIDGKADVILVARGPSPDELAAAKAKGVELETTPIALDAFVFLANVQNPVESLPLTTIRDVYTGKITTWAQAGVSMSDPNAPIHAYQRQRNSGSQELMDSLVMKGTPTINAPEMIVTTMLGPFNAIGGDSTTGGGDTLGLGYSVYYYASVMFSHQQIKLVGVDGVKPTSATIASRAYPLVAEVYAVTLKGTPANSPAITWRNWLVSPDGQRVIKESGYVPLPEKP